MPFGEGDYPGKEEAKKVLTRGVKKEKKDAGSMAKEAHKKNLEARKDAGQPSADIPKEKAKQILKEGEVKGKPLSEKQKGLFGSAAGKGE